MRPTIFDRPAPESIHIVHRWVMPCAVVRYRLSNGWFIDGARNRAHYSCGWKYGIYIPGASEHGCALLVGGADTLEAALSIAGRTSSSRSDE